MIDEDRGRSRAHSETIDSETKTRSGSRNSTAPLTLATTTDSSGSATDDESHIKRRASPTDLVLGVDDGAPSPSSDLGLTRRPSVKRMRAEVEKPSPVGGNGPSAKDSPGKVRSRSKLVGDAEGLSK